jgi:hypothetical protein
VSVEAVCWLGLVLHECMKRAEGRAGLRHCSLLRKACPRRLVQNGAVHVVTAHHPQGCITYVLHTCMGTGSPPAGLLQSPAARVPASYMHLQHSCLPRAVLQAPTCCPEHPCQQALHLPPTPSCNSQPRHTAPRHTATKRLHQQHRPLLLLQVPVQHHAVPQRAALMHVAHVQRAEQQLHRQLGLLGGVLRA